MKNKQINKVLLMFFLSFTLFFSVSNAFTLEANVDYTYVSDNDSTISSFASYSSSTINTICINYFNDNSNEAYIKAFNDMISVFANEGYDKYLIHSFKYPAGNSDIYAHFFPSSVDVAVNSNNDTVYFFMDTSENHIFWKGTVGRLYESKLKSLGAYEIGFRPSNSFYTNVNIKQTIASAQSNYFYWDGISYFYKVETEPEAPSANYDLAGIIDVIKNSTEIQDNVYPYLEEYFIIPDGTIGNEEVYEIYFYYPSVNLSQFEYVFNDSLYYDLDKTSIDGVISKLTYYLGGDTKSNVVKDVQKVTLYYNPETGSGDIYLTSTMTLNELKSFNSDTQPIIYTTKDITYYSATWGENDTEWTAIADESKNIITTEIVDSEGNVVDPMLPSSSTAILGETPFERFVNVIRTAILGLGETVSQGLIDFTDYLLNLFGENVVTFMFLIIIKSVTVLVSSVALIFRFVSFIMTLVSIPASSALFSIDVATNSSGLLFNGLNWGSRFVEGLNLLKSFQWNGLGLWTLFEVFVASLEVVFFVKIVRKHYRNL